jgi:hypothetical protein
MRTFAVTYTPLLTRLTALFVAVIVVSLFLYAIFLLEAVAHTASRAHAETDIEAMATELSSLETQYLTLTRSVTPERAALLGFVAPTSVTTVFESGGALSFHE